MVPVEPLMRAPVTPSSYQLDLPTVVRAHETNAQSDFSQSTRTLLELIPRANEPAGNAFNTCELRFLNEQQIWTNMFSSSRHEVEALRTPDSSQILNGFSRCASG
ncbi:hypothetical protein EVAR_103872_1 [Eumeta japonica]|uniref:Uncharacterized protein n=1 Tax=Eumeta variegata TaxID=151549 RepID=A0A4C1SPV8_EUMVA|nr:hypothetical protein EVAR_103872_1 [Eumeta japonica]